MDAAKHRSRGPGTSWSTVAACVTLSIGVAEFAGDRKRFFDAADRALYRAKAAGKNCVMAATPSELG